jgi:2'-5'-oligoadenylate synthetase
MKVQVNLKIASQAGATGKVELNAEPTDTVHVIKERIATSQLIAFPDQHIEFNGMVLQEIKSLTDYGVKENSSLDFVINATEASLVSQLTELLQARELSCDELGLLYTYKHGVSVNQALKTIGYQEKLQDFIRKQKEFMLENGKVVLKRSDVGLKPFSVADECKKILEENHGSMEITNLCSKFTQKFNVSMQSIVNMRPAEFLLQEKDVFVMSGVPGRGQVSLKSVQQQKPKKETQPPKPVREPEVVRPKVTLKPPGIETPEETSESEEYLELHNTISGRSFNSKVAQLLTEVVDIVSENAFFNISHVVKGGSVGKGTAINGCTDAEVVFFVKGLPYNKQNKWLPSMLKAVAGVLNQHLETALQIVDHLSVTEDSICMKVRGMVEVNLRFSSDFESYTQTLNELGALGPDGWKHMNTALAKEKVLFVSKQPGQVKVTMRLLKWWRDQQQWTSEHTTPSDDVLELIAVYSALQTKPKDQRTAIANAMSLMARFNELRVVWSNYYDKEQIWAPLVQQRPLLMDPVNPYVNVADPQKFDSSELMALSRTTHFFW